MDQPEAVESFTIPQAAEALGRSVSTLRRWLEGDRLPAPYLEDVARHHKVYSVGELETIARVIAAHEREFVYLVAENTHIVHMLHQAVHAYRAEFI
jgi:transcriptional regulator with XRE-family HTH domain